jgi:hypothetical protein
MSHYFAEAYQPDVFELHYHFNDNSHFIDAMVRHKCEAEMLYMVKEIMSTLELSFDIAIEPPENGGFIDRWRWLGQNKDQVQLITPYVLLLLMPLISIIPKPTTKLEKLQQESTTLDIEEKRLKIEALRKSILNREADTSALTAHFENDHKIIKHRSNFYNTLKGYDKIDKISVVLLSNKTPVANEATVNKADFDRFIVKSDELPKITVSKAIIEIIAPVLKKSKFKWKGVYEGQTIDFSMSDTKFKSRVSKRLESFESECYIECTLEIKRKINDLGEVQNVSYKVITVTGRVQDSKIIETEQGKRLRHEQQIEETVRNQTTLF